MGKLMYIFKCYAAYGSGSAQDTCPFIRSLQVLITLDPSIFSCGCYADPYSRTRSRSTYNREVPENRIHCRLLPPTSSYWYTEALASDDLSSRRKRDNGSINETSSSLMAYILKKYVPQQRWLVNDADIQEVVDFGIGKEASTI